MDGILSYRRLIIFLIAYLISRSFNLRFEYLASPIVKFVGISIWNCLLCPNETSTVITMYGNTTCSIVHWKKSTVFNWTIVKQRRCRLVSNVPVPKHAYMGVGTMLLSLKTSVQFIPEYHRLYFWKAFLKLDFKLIKIKCKH